ncbi:hypothetical protein WJX75_005803 [Coccomyxa subellipsoidea]|uniref:Uncharacterized protein n=1 Tax=Coccomyxa subellipsoidea TaxID=248742 RepID=A0ABR2Z392_9CHLO
MQTSTSVQSLSIRNLQPLSEHIASATDFVAWLYPQAPKGTQRCSPKGLVDFSPGAPLSIPGGSRSMVVYGDGYLNVTSGGQTSQIPIPLDSTVEACRSGMLYLVNVVGKDGSVLSEVAFNSQTGCIGANTVQVASLQGGSSADPASDTAYAIQAGIPLPAGYTPLMADSATPALNPNPCLGQDPGFSNGLSTAFYGGSIGKGQFDTHTPTFQRCDCPNHKTVNASWPGYPPLPQGNFINSYGARMVGEFLVTRPEDGVVGETPESFPAASDYHLVCLQHDDSAEMIIEGSSYYSSDSNTSTPAGFKQYCVPVSLAPGWHGLELRYSKAPLDRTSVFRFFVVDAEQVETVYTSGVPSNQILWKVCYWSDHSSL